MATFKEQLEVVKASINALITKETPQEQIDSLVNISKQVDGLGESHQKTLDDYGALKDRYIESIKGFGSKATPSDDPQEKSLEDIGKEIISNRGKQ